jgi:DNA-binding NarL/FixJ family response regulator
MAAPRSIRVFLVDDVRELRLLVRLTLEEDPDIEIVGEASDGHSGVEGVAETQPDVVLLDLSMPDMDGLEALPLMRERAPNARLVVLSGHEAGRVSLEALNQGATRYVNKAADLKAIRSAVREVARLEPPFTDERFHVVHRMWTAYLNGAIDQMLKEAHPDATWQPYAGAGRELRSHGEMRSFMEGLTAEGRVVDPRAYGAEPHGRGLMVIGTLEIRGPGGLTETEVYWTFCFRGDKVMVAAGFDQRDAALQTIRDLCGST